MTQAQKRAMEKLRKMAERELFFGGPEKWEFKRFEVTDESYTGDIFLAIETGMKGDEGTMAEIYAREYCHLIIGPKGGVTWYRWSKDGKKATRRYMCEHHHILAAVIDQRR